MGASFPEVLVSVLCMQNAELPRQEESLALASTRESLISESAATTMRGLLESCGSAARQEILAAEDAEDHEACAAYRKAKKQGLGKKKGNGLPKRSSDKKKGGQQRKTVRKSGPDVERV